MARFALCLIACALVAAVAATPADPEFLTKQKEIVKLLNKVHELNFYQDQATVGTEYDPLAHLDSYKVSPKKNTSRVLGVYADFVFQKFFENN